MAGCGRVGKWRAGWPASSGLPRSVSNGAGRRCARSSGRSRSRARVTPRRPRPRRKPRLKKTRRSRCRRGRAPSRPPGRGVRDRRAPPRPEAGPAPRVGAQGRAPDPTRPSPLYVTAFTQPLSGETVWYVSTGVSKAFFAALLAAFAEETRAGRERIIVLVLDQAGWHTEPNLPVP